MNLGELYRKEHRLPEAEKTLRQAAALAKEFEQQRPELHPETLSRLGVIYLDSGHYEDAGNSLREAVTLFAALSPPVPAEEAYAWNGTGMLDLASGHQAESWKQSLRRAVALATLALGEGHPETASYQTNLALALTIKGEFNSAGILLRRAKAVIEARSGPSDFRLGSCSGRTKRVRVRRE